MRHDVKMSTASITKKKFIQQMKNQQYNWKDIFDCYQFFQKIEIKSEARQLTNSKLFYISCSYYQLSVHISYSQSYFISTYFSQDEWFLQEYNSYWENKTQQQDFILQHLEFQNNQSTLSVSKQLLMITTDTVTVLQAQSVYSNFEWEANFCWNQEWYEHVIKN